MRTVARLLAAFLCLQPATRLIADEPKARAESTPAAPATAADAPAEAPPAGAPTAAPAAPAAAQPATEVAPKPPEPIGLADFARLPFGTLPTLSPDGAEMAIVYRTEGGGQAVAVQSAVPDALGAPRVLGVLRARPRWTRWTKGGRVLVSLERHQHRTEVEALERPVESPRPIYRYNPATRRTEIAGYEIPPQPPRKAIPAGRVVQLHSFNAAEGRGRHLARDWDVPVTIQDDVISWLPADPGRILLSVDEVERFGGRGVLRPAALAVSVTSGGKRTIVYENRRVQRWFADHDGEVRLGEGIHPDGTTVLYRREGRKLVEIPTFIGAIEASLRFAGYSYDPDVIYAWAPVQGRQALVALRLSDSSVEGIYANEQFDVTGPLVFDEAQRKLVGVAYVADVPQLHAIDESLATEREMMARALPGLVLEYVSESADRNLVLVRASSDVRPPAYYTYDRRQRRMNLELTEYPRLEAETLRPMEPVRLFARDGLAIPAYLTRPAEAAAKPPAIVWVHDGPDERAHRRFDPLVQWLARRGFVVLEPNYRGSAGYGLALRSAGFGEWGGTMQNDLDDAAAWLAAEGIADPKRIGIYGRGYGGYAALMAVLREGSPFRAASSHGGPTDLDLLLEDDDRDRVEPDWSRRVLGARKLKAKRLLELSPISHVAKLERPVLLLHSEHDERVRFVHSESFAKAAIKLGKPVELVGFENELYEPALELHRLLWFEKLTGFFEKALAAEAPPAPVAAPATEERAS
jgi:dipeptidyl aminopeptidase/acylaminoacyl peptidase